MSKRQMKVLYLILWALGATLSFILQFFFPAIITEGTIWGFSLGWQHEIAFWNLAFIFLIVVALLKKERTMIEAMAWTTMLLSLLFAINHIIAFFTNSQSWVHELASIANGFAFFLGMFVLFLGRNES